MQIPGVNSKPSNVNNFNGDSVLKAKGMVLKIILTLILIIKLTRGQRPNESQKAVIIDMIKSVGEIASKMWPVV